ncbi:MAG: Tim44 domain-containing protein, partial [Planctomycetota bacterium]
MNTMRRLVRTLLLVCSLVGLLFLVIPDSASGRAGGGRSFSSGRSYSGSSRSGGDGEGMILYLLIRLCISHPYIGIPLLIGALYLFYKGGGQANMYHQGRVISRGRSLQNQVMREGALHQIRERDPTFDEPAFLKRVGGAFTKLQKSWCDQELAPIRPYVSDGIFERFSLQIAEQKKRGVKDHMENLVVRDVSVTQLLSDPVFDTVTVRIRASAVDYTVNVKTGKRVDGDSTPDSFVEYWSFLRRPGAKSLAADGLMEGNCPNCGAGLSLNEASKCGSCGSIIRSGEYDWVLAEITQGSEWVAQEERELPGMSTMKLQDPGFCVQHLEDRASVMFWRLIQTWQEGKDKSIRKMATDDFCTGFAKRFKADDKGVVRYPGDVAIGAVNCLGVGEGTKDVDDLAVMEMRWSARRYTRDGKGKVKRTPSASISTHHFVMARKHGVKSD